MPSDLAIASAGAVSAAFSTAAVYPLDTVKTYLNKGDKDGEKLTNVFQVLASFNGKWSKLFAGIQAKLIMSMTQKFLYFYIYSYLRRRVKTTSVLHSLILGYVSAIVAVGILTPIEVAQTRQQLGSPRSIFSILAQICRIENGIAGCYKGLGTNIILCVNPAIEYTVFEKLKIHHRNSLSDGEAFLMGAIAKAVATITTFPLVRAKVLQQSSEKKVGLSEILAALFANEGISSWFAGMQTQLVKNVIASALMLAMKERIERKILYR